MTPICPYCRTSIDSDENREDCKGCNTPHHADCYAENGGCTVFGCSDAPTDEPKLTVSGEEAAHAVAAIPLSPIAPAPPLVPPPPPVIPPPSPVVVPRAPSVLGLDDPLVLDGSFDSSCPPDLYAPAAFLAAARELGAAGTMHPLPSVDSTNVPPPPQPPGTFQPVPAAVWSVPPPTPAEAYANFHARKSRVTYVLLGVFLGALGVHNFYAGYVRKAVAQLCISLFTCFYGSIVSWIWAVFEVCTVHQDSEGVQFS